MWQYNELYHHGILGMKWGIRRYQNPDGSLTEAGRERYGYKVNSFRWYGSDVAENDRRLDEAGLKMVVPKGSFNGDNPEKAVSKYLKPGGLPTEEGRRIFCANRTLYRNEKGELTPKGKELFIEEDLRKLKEVACREMGARRVASELHGRAKKQASIDRGRYKDELYKRSIQAAIDYGLTNEKLEAMHEGLEKLKRQQHEKQIKEHPEDAGYGSLRREYGEAVNTAMEKKFGPMVMYEPANYFPYGVSKLIGY